MENRAIACILSTLIYGGGTLAVYTVLSKAFSNKIYPDYEKVAY